MRGFARTALAIGMAASIGADWGDGPAERERRRRLLDLMHRWVTAPLRPVPRPVLDDPEQRHFGHVIHLRAVASAREGWSRVRDQLAHLAKHGTPLERAVNIANHASALAHGPHDRGTNLASFMVGAVTRRMTS